MRDFYIGEYIFILSILASNLVVILFLILPDLSINKMTLSVCDCVQLGLHWNLVLMGLDLASSLYNAPGPNPFVFVQ